MISCPHCFSGLDVILFGKNRGKQRYRCNSCQKIFTESPQWSPVTDSEIEAYIFLYNKGKTFDEIGFQFGKTGSAVRKSLVGRIEFVPLSERRITSEEVDIIQAYKFGLTCAEVGLRFNLNPSSVYDVLVRHKISRRKTNHRAIASTAAIAKQYWGIYAQGYSCQRVAELFEVSTSAVRQALKSSGYSLRTQAETKKKTKTADAAMVESLIQSGSCKKYGSFEWKTKQ